MFTVIDSDPLIHQGRNFEGSGERSWANITVARLLGPCRPTLLCIACETAGSVRFLPVHAAKRNARGSTATPPQLVTGAETHPSDSCPFAEIPPSDQCSKETS